MDRIRRAASHWAHQVASAERFVGLVVAGGLALLAGLWTLTLGRGARSLTVLGSGLVLLGAGLLARGIWSQVEY